MSGSGWGGISASEVDTIALTAAEGNAAYLGKTGATTPTTVLLYSGTFNTGTLNQGVSIYTVGSATAGIGLIIPFACTMTKFAVTMSTLTCNGTSGFDISLFKNATVGGAAVFDFTVAPQTADIPLNGADTGSVTLNGTTDYIVIATTCTAGGTSIVIVGGVVAVYGTIT